MSLHYVCIEVYPHADHKIWFENAHFADHPGPALLRSVNEGVAGNSLTVRLSSTRVF